MTRNQLNQLIDEVIDKTISEADFLRLEAQLHVDPAARKLYYERLKLDTVLRLESEEKAESKILRLNFATRKRATFISLASAAAVIIGIFGWLLGHHNPPTDLLAEREEPLATGFGVLAEESNTVWKTPTLTRGELLPQGEIVLSEGIAQLELFSGVTVVFEGAASFQLHSAMEMTVNSGKMRAIVPKPARGFRVKTSSGDVVDLGTEFALDVDPDRADLHVLNGEIEWHPNAKPMRTLTDGDSLRWLAKGDAEILAFQGDEFAGLGEIEKNRSQKYSDWLNYTRKISSDPRLLAYYPMTREGSWNRTLMDHSGSHRDGTIVRANRTTDRWGKTNKALDFGATGSRVRMDIPGEHSALTLFCWVKIGSLDRWYNSLFLTDGHELNEPHWQIMDDGRLFFSVKRRDYSKDKPSLKDKKVAYSPPFWNQEMSGQWVQLATVYDSRDKSVTHYLNGRELSREILPDEYVVDKVKIGAASIGNWSDPYRYDPHFSVRNLNGAIDEFAIFSEALSGSEIAELYERGKP